MTPERIRILLVEDDPADAELLVHALTAGGLRVAARRAASAEAMRHELGETRPDIILSDYTMPSFSGTEALAIAREALPEVPFLFVSGTIGEERAVDAIRNGAADYLLKDRLSRLVPAVRRALEEAKGRHDKARLEEELRQGQKLQVVGALASGIAHDFNNILTAISGYGEMVQETFEESDPRRADMEEIRRSVGRASMLTRQLLTFARKRPIKAQLIDLGEIAEGVARMLQRLVGEQVHLKLKRQGEAGAVLADAGHLEQVLLNLAINARDAMPKGGELTITTFERDGSSGWSVADTGSGIPAGVVERIFEPFFTTKDHGTGLGLSTVRQIVEQYQGKVKVESGPGAGTVFTICFPVAGGRPEAAAGAGASESLGGHETLLLVEDDASVRELLSRQLEAKGYKVLQAATGPRAIELQDGIDVDALLVDIVLKGMSGPETAQEILVRRPKLKVLFLSGYIDDMMPRYGLSEDSVSYLQKPFTPHELLIKLRAVLGAA